MNTEEELLAHENQFLLVALLKYLSTKDGALLKSITNDLEAQYFTIQSSSERRKLARTQAVNLLKKL